MQKKMMKYYNENPELLNNKLKYVGSRHARKRRMHEVNKIIKAKDKVLELGCGAGHELKGINAKEIIGIDISKENIKRANDKGKIILGDACNIPLKKNQFNTAIILELIEHISDKERLITQIKHILKKGGTLIITTPNPKMWWAQRILEAMKLVVKEAGHEYINNKDLIRMIKKKGFKIIKNQYIFFPPIPRVIKPLEGFLNKTPLKIIGLSQLIVATKT